MSYDKFAPPPYVVQANPPYAVQANPPYAVPVVANYGMQTGFNTVLIKDYLAWSLINLFCGWGIGGFIPLIFSILCRNYKSVNDYSGAQSMSTIALVFNIIVTVAGTIGWIIFIIIMAIYIVAINSLR